MKATRGLCESEKNQELQATSATSSTKMSSNLATKLFLLVLITWSDAAINLNVTTAFPGNNSVISCSNNGQSSSDFQMEFTPAGSGNPVILYSQSFERLNPKFSQQYSVSGDSDLFELTILNASPDHAGLYTCDWGYRSQETELVILAPSGPTCQSNVLRENDCETDVRFECSVDFHGNVLPTVEFWMVTGSITIGPITAPAHREHNTSKTTLIQTISSVSGDIKYACQLPAINKGLPARGYCSFERNPQSCTNLESAKAIILIIGGVLAGIVVAAALVVIHRKQIRLVLNTNNSEGEESIPLLSKKMSRKIELKDIEEIKQENVQHLDTTKSIQFSGVAWMKDRIYMCGLGSNTIHVFAGNSPFNPELNISIPSAMAICDLSACAADDGNLFLFFRNSLDPKLDGGPHKSYVWRCDIPDESFHQFKIEGRILKLSSTLSGEILILKLLDFCYFMSVLEPTRAREQPHKITKLPPKDIIGRPEQIMKLANGNFILTGQHCSKGEIQETKTIYVFEINFSNGDIVHSCCSFSGPTGNTFSLPEIYTLTLDQHNHIFITDSRKNEIVSVDLQRGEFRKILDSITEKMSEKPFQNIHYIPEKHMALEIRSNLARILL